jgi:hypothetical protein
MVGSPSMWSTRSRLFCAVRDEEGGDQLSDYGVVDRVPPTVAARDPHPTPRPWAVGSLPRSQLVAQLADQVRLNAGDQSPGWAARPHAFLPPELIAHLQVWRAATQVDPNDLRPTRPPQLGRATESSNSNSTYDSPPIPTQIGNGGNCSPQKSPAPPKTHSCRSWQRG